MTKTLLKPRNKPKYKIKSQTQILKDSTSTIYFQFYKASNKNCHQERELLFYR